MSLSRINMALVGSGLAALGVSGAVQAAADQVVIEVKLTQVTSGDVFDNLAHLAGAIDLGSANSVLVQNVRGVWGLTAPSRFSGLHFDAAYLAATRVGVQWEIQGFRDLTAVLNAPDVPQFGRSTGGVLEVFSKIGSDSVLSGTTTKLGLIRSFKDLQWKPTSALELEARYSFARGTSGEPWYASGNEFFQIAQIGDEVPGRPGQSFTGFAPQGALSKGYAAFVAQSPGVSGVYGRYGNWGSLSAVLENEFTTNPYGFINAVDLDGKTIGIASEKALLRGELNGGSAPQVLVPAGTSYAVGAAVSFFSEVNVEGDRVAFRALANGGLGAFVADPDGSVTKIADSSTPVPGGIGTFTSAQQIGISDELITFIGFDSAFKQAGLFAHYKGELLRIAGPGDSKDGKTVTLVDFVPGALHHNVLAYTSYFNDGSSASYLVAVVPEPSRAALLLAGLAIVCVWVRRRRGWTRHY